MKTEKQILKHLKNKFSKNDFEFLDSFNGGGSYYHYCFLRNDGKIITYNHIKNNSEYDCLEISYNKYNNLKNYMNDMVSGFGWEWKNPNYDQRIWNI